MSYKKYRTVHQTMVYPLVGDVPLPPNVNAIEFYVPTTNSVNGTALVNNQREIPIGGAYAISGNENEVDHSQYFVSIPQGVNGDKVVLTFKIYE